MAHRHGRTGFSRSLIIMNSKTTAPKLRDGQNVAEVHDLLRLSILRGELAPGSHVSLVQLARTFNIGRTPLREALRLLQGEGLVIATPNRQIRIATLSANDFEGISIARLALETVAIRITVPSLTSADFAALEGYLAQMDHFQKKGDLAGLWTPHRAFHRLLVAGAGDRVQTQIDALTDLSERYRLRFGILGKWEASRAEHRAILDAAAAGDGDLAAGYLAIHYVHTIALVFSALDSGHDISRLRTTLRAVAPGAEDAFQDG